MITVLLLIILVLWLSNCWWVWYWATDEGQFSLIARHNIPTLLVFWWIVVPMTVIHYRQNRRDKQRRKEVNERRRQQQQPTR